MNWEEFFDTSDIRIIIYLRQRDHARYSELEKKVVRTRSVLSVALQDLIARKIVDRTIEPTKPIQAKYALTSRGRRIAELLEIIQKVLKE